MGRRNNAARTKAPKNPAAAPPVSNKSDLFAFVNPTEFVELPSQGEYYSADHPLSGEKVIEIKHMTAKEEDILTSEALLNNELAVDRLLESVIVDSSIGVDDLLLGDKNAILIATRITGFGPFYTVGATCKECAQPSEYTFDLGELSSRERNTPPEAKHEGAGIFSFELPISKVRIHVKLLTSRDEKHVTKLLLDKSGNGTSNPVTGLLRAIIVQANEHTDSEMLNKFIDVMPLPDVHHLRKMYDLVKPDVDLRFDFTCDHCSHEGKVGMPMTAAFFWPNA